jgi:hypothetical protein
MPDVLPATVVALFVAVCATCISGTIGAWMPLYLANEKHWTTAEYSTFYVCWGLVGFLGLCLSGWLADKIGRRMAFIVSLVEGAIAFAFWIYAESHVMLWIFGLAWASDFLAFGTEYNADRGSFSHSHPRHGQWRGMGNCLFHRPRPISIRHRGAPAINWIIHAIVPLHSRDDDLDGDRRLFHRPRTFRQGTKRNHHLTRHDYGGMLQTSRSKASTVWALKSLGAPYDVIQLGFCSSHCNATLDPRGDLIPGPARVKSRCGRPVASDIARALREPE